MYAVFLDRKLVRTNKRFRTYEQARQYVRKQIRSAVKGYERNVFWTSNPMIGDYGYHIKQV